MNFDMKKWKSDYIDSNNKKAIPVLSFPAVQLLGISVKDLVSDSKLQAKGIIEVAKRCNTGAALSMMDLSVEAEAFGAKVELMDDEVPRILDATVSNEEEIHALRIPEVGAGRTSVYIDAVRESASMITDRPVFAGAIGPFSLAGRLFDMAKIMLNVRRNPDMVLELVEKCTIFLIKYIKAFKEAGANGVVLAEPAAGLLSPKMIGKFSCEFCKRIVDELQDDSFMIIYHNCGGSVVASKKEISEIGAWALHFGDVVELSEMFEGFPEDVLIMGNVSPGNFFLKGTPESIKVETRRIIEACGSHNNFVISSGCDIPPMTPWENIDAFFEAAKQ